jgi:PilZ domain-containing protein
MRLLAFSLNPTDWTLWASVAAGIAAAALVVMLAILYGRWRRRRRLMYASTEEDLPWDELLELLRKRSSERAAAGLTDDDDLPPEALLQELLSGRPFRPRPKPQAGPEEVQFGAGAAERRAGRRRWGNPTEVYLTSQFWPASVHGLVINRSTGGLAVFVDQEAPEGSNLKIRSVEAPKYVPTVEIEVRYCRKVGKNYLLGCQFCGEIPWNARVWFG